MYTIERSDREPMRYETREEALRVWDAQCDSCVKGDVIRILAPDGSILSEYTCNSNL